jgi:cysteinyl-tRNA synthetase
MSKSLGNYYTLKDLLKKGYRAEAIRFLLFSSHYRSILDFSEDSLLQAERTVEHLYNFIKNIKEAQVSGKLNKELHDLLQDIKIKFEEAMDNDLNTPKALSELFNLIQITNRIINENRCSKKNLKEIYRFIVKINQIFGLFLEKNEKISNEISHLINLRNEARKKKDWITADQIRTRLYDEGIMLEDTPKGTKWKKLFKKKN